MTRVLICDDHLVFAESLGQILAATSHHDVTVTSHPREAIEALGRTGADVCLLDVLYGEESILGYLAQIRAVADGARIALLTGHVDHDLVTAARHAGVHAVAGKAQAVTEIVAMIDQILQGGTALPSGALRPARTRTAPANDAHRLAAYLTPKERQVLSALVRGRDTAGLARELGITLATARCHIQNVLTKMGAHSRLEAVTTAARHWMVDHRTGEWLV